ncbi:MAG: 3-oxoadipyl-CoA thiolase [Tateyamaria sp.]|jgi:acetyl-CoA acyltransferase|nr:3-oxoadipyl-CoA thiolase [Tateyamaria sp.]MBT5301790.1 3-oxoadipyl-CoA thiolase [Tateyamaria sp.]MBT6266336.1 3-oxoadipyl-CoA thiolase [Tateyamaria sp.]
MDAFICDAQRTPIGRYGGSLSTIRTDDLAAIPIASLISRNPNVDWSNLDDIILGCANQAGEDNRNVARMAALLAGLPTGVPGATINRLCASGMDAVGIIARGIKSGEIDIAIAGGIENMSRAPFVLPKAEAPFSRTNQIYDTTIGWRFVNPKIKKQYGIDSMPETAENVAKDWNISRADQDAFAARSQERWKNAHENGEFKNEITPVIIPQSKVGPVTITEDEHPRPDTNLDTLGQLKSINGLDKTVTAGNASGLNDGSAALLIASTKAAEANGLTPMARIVGMSAAGVEPRIMGIGPVPACQKVLHRAGLTLNQMDIIELNEAFASQGLATLRSMGIADDDSRVNARGGAIALGHPLGMSGARLVISAAYQLQQIDKRYALCTMCVGVGQGVALVLERAS